MALLVDCKRQPTLLPEEPLKRPCPSYDTLSAYLRSRVADASAPQIHNLALFLYGLLLAGHVPLPKIALYVPLDATAKSAVQRLERFLKNKALAPSA